MISWKRDLAFIIHSQELLLVLRIQKSLLRDRRRFWKKRNQIDLCFFAELSESLAIHIIADHADQIRSTVEAGNIVSDIGCSSEFGLLFFDVQQRHRRFRILPIGISVDIFIKHGIAYHGDLGHDYFFWACKISMISHIVW